MPGAASSLEESVHGAPVELPLPGRLARQTGRADSGSAAAALGACAPAAHEPAPAQLHASSSLAAPSPASQAGSRRVVAASGSWLSSAGDRARMPAAPSAISGVPGTGTQEAVQSPVCAGAPPSGGSAGGSFTRGGGDGAARAPCMAQQLVRQPLPLYTACHSLAGQPDTASVCIARRGPHLQLEQHSQQGGAGGRTRVRAAASAAFGVLGALHPERREGRCIIGRRCAAAWQGLLHVQNGIARASAAVRATVEAAQPACSGHSCASL